MMDDEPRPNGPDTGRSPAVDEAEVALLAASVGRRAFGDGGPEAVFVASFAEFYQIHHQRIAQSLALNFGDAELGREATDEAMTRAFQRWGTVSGHDNPAGWVYRVGLNWGRSWFRRAGRRLPWLDRQNAELPETSDPSLRAALLAMNPKLREVVVCRYFLDWSTNQTAAALDLPTGTVKSRLHQALAELRRELTDHSDEAVAPFAAPDRSAAGATTTGDHHGS
ncbi:MAG: sigma factor-like helix-turn-helix DNA-binding protein [Actinomycetota bacterium]